MKRFGVGLKGIKTASVHMFVIGLGFAATRVLAFAIGVLVARYAGVSTFGQFTLFITVYVIATELPNAIDITYIRFSSAEKSDCSAKDYLSINLLSKLVYFLILLFTALVVLSGAFIGEPAVGSMAIIAKALAAGGVYSVFLSLVAVHQQMRAFNMVALLRPLLNVIVIIALVCLIATNNFDFGGIVLTYFAAGTMLSVSSLLVMHDCLLHMRHVVTGLRRHLKRYSRVCLILMLSTVLSLIANRLDVFFITGALSSEDLGQYGAALRLIVLVSLVTSVSSTILMPRAPLVWTDSSVRRIFFMQAAFYFLVQAGVAVILFIFMDVIIATLFGGEYLDVSPIASMLLLQVLFTALGLPFQLLVQCSDKPEYMIALNMARLALGVVVLSVLVPSYGVMGAAIGVTVTSFFLMTAMTGLVFVLMSRKKGIAQLSDG